MMAAATQLLLPALVTGIFLHGLWKGVPVFDSFLRGAGEGLKTAFSITPALVCLLTVLSMFRASGGLDLLLWAVSPVAALFKIPGEVLPLAMMRPLSGSGALVFFREVLERCGPDSFSGRVASVLMGSTETTFYTIAVYYGAVKVRDTGFTLPAALAGDLTSLLVSGWAVRLFLGGL